MQQAKVRKKDKKFCSISDEQGIESNNMVENNDDIPRDVFETLNTNPDLHQANQECYQNPTDLPIPVIRIESPTSAESSFSEAETSDRSNDDTRKVIIHS